MLKFEIVEKGRDCVVTALAIKLWTLIVLSCGENKI